MFSLFLKEVLLLLLFQLAVGLQVQFAVGLQVQLVVGLQVQLGVGLQVWLGVGLQVPLGVGLQVQFVVGLQVPLVIEWLWNTTFEFSVLGPLATSFNLSMTSAEVLVWVLSLLVGFLAEGALDSLSGHLTTPFVD